MDILMYFGFNGVIYSVVRPGTKGSTRIGTGKATLYVIPKAESMVLLMANKKKNNQDLIERLKNNLSDLADD